MWLPPQAQLLQRPQLITEGYLLNKVDGSLATLSKAGGFRRLVLATAESIGIRGYVQRFTHTNVKVMLEGTHDQMEQMYNVLLEWQGLGMFGSLVPIPHSHSEGYVFHSFRKFEIIESHSRTSGPRHAVVNGEHSNDMEKYDKITEYSASTTEAR